MNEDGVRVTRIDWLAVVPSLRLLEAIRLAVSLRVVIPVVLLIFLSRYATPITDERLNELNGMNPVPGVLNVSVLNLPEYLRGMNQSLILIATEGVWQLFVSINMLGLWMLMLGFCGVAVIRSAGCRFCTGTGRGVIESGRYSLQSWKAVLISTFLSWSLLGLLCVAFRILSWTGARSHVGITTMASLMYITGCLVLAIGWLLSIAAIAIDRCDGAEALSRGICYVLSQWMRLFVYVMVYCLLATICDVAVSWITDNARALASATHKTPEQLMSDGFRAAAFDSLEQFRELIRLSIFLCAIAIAYVLLRNVEDGVSMQEIDGGRNS